MLSIMAHAAPFLTEPFTYTTGNLGGKGTWTSSNSGVTVGTNNLDGTSFGLAPSAGNKVITTTSSSSGTYNQFSEGINSGSVYFSFLLKVNSTASLSTTGQPLVDLLKAGSASSYYADVYLRLNGGNVEIGLGKLRNNVTYFTTPLTLGQTYLIAGKYVFTSGSSNDRVSLWINPTFDEGDEPPADISFTTGGDGNDNPGLGRCYIYGGAAADVDELRLGSTWADVTPSSGLVGGGSIPYVTQTLLGAQGLVLRGTNGNPNSSYKVISSTNATLPQSQWPAVATNQFDASGNFDCTNPVTAGVKQGFYRVQVGNASVAAPSITTPPQDQTVQTGQNATFAVTAIGTAPLSYQWYFNTNTLLAGATASSLTLTNAGTNNAGGYSVVVANSAGSVTSSVARLTITNFSSPPFITGQPQNQTAAVGQTVSFTVSAAGTAPLVYRWYFNTNTPVGTNATLTLNNITTNNAGKYSVIITNSLGTTNSVFATLTVNVPDTNAPDFSHVGFASYNFNLTGGAGGQEVTVTTGEELKTYADSNEPYIIYVSGTLQISGMDTHVRPNKTIIGLGTDATLQGGGLYLYRSTNVIIRNITIKDSEDDNIGITTFSQNIWVDHCTFLDAADGTMDISKGSDYVTVSWCKFYYSQTENYHRFVNLVGASDGDGGRDMNRLHVTFHHNWWSTNCVERMPSLRYGRADVYNNYFNAPGNNYCVRTRLYAESRVENNWFENVQNPWEIYLTTGTPPKIWAAGNVQVNTTWTTNYPATDDVFVPPYNRVLDAATTIPSTVITHAGAGKGPFAP